MEGDRASGKLSRRLCLSQSFVGGKVWTRRSAARRSSRGGNGPSPLPSGAQEDRSRAHLLAVSLSFRSGALLVDYIVGVERDHPECQIAELVVRHWWQTPLHNQRAQLLKLLLLVRDNQRIVVINIPWYL
jgi:hypothetical protein